jgi:hypothetical protein
VYVEFRIPLCTATQRTQSFIAMFAVVIRRGGCCASGCRCAEGAETFGLSFEEGAGQHVDAVD